MNSTPNKIYFTQKDIVSMLNKIIAQMKVDNYEPNAIVGLNRGGLQIAVMLSHYFDVPCIPIKASLRDHQSWDTTVPPGKYLVIDDICDEGWTLAGLKGDYDDEEDIEVKYAVLHYNRPANFLPDYWAVEIDKSKDPCWIVYPWEEWHMDQH